MRTIKDKNIKWWLNFIFCFLLFAFIGVFAYAKMEFLIEGVKIEAQIIYKEGGPLVEVVGNCPKATYLSLNGREIFIDKEGGFSEMISLLPGYQVITINAKDRFGNRDEKKIDLYYKI